MKLLPNKLFNFNTFVFSFNLNVILGSPDSLPCSCKGSQYEHKDYGHITTGHLCVISENK